MALGGRSRKQLEMVINTQVEGGGKVTKYINRMKGVEKIWKKLEAQTKNRKNLSAFEQKTLTTNIRLMMRYTNAINSQFIAEGKLNKMKKRRKVIERELAVNYQRAGDRRRKPEGRKAAKENIDPLKQKLRGLDHAISKLNKEMKKTGAEANKMDKEFHQFNKTLKWTSKTTQEIEQDFRGVGKSFADAERQQEKFNNTSRRGADDLNRLRKRARETGDEFVSMRIKTAEHSFRRLLGSIRNQILVVVFATRALVGALKNVFEETRKTEAALTGLSSVALNTGAGMNQARDAAISLSKDGLITVTEAAAGLKNLLAAGLALPKAIQLMKVFKNSAAFNRQGTLSMGEAIVGATQGVKNMNSIMVDNAGITKNLSIMYKEYAASVGTTAGKLTDAQKVQASYEGIIREGAVFSGDALKSIMTVNGAIARMTASTKKSRIEFGEIFNPIIKEFVILIDRGIIQKMTQWIKLNKELIKDNLNEWGRQIILLFKSLATVFGSIIKIALPLTAILGKVFIPLLFAWRVTKKLAILQIRMQKLTKSTVTFGLATEGVGRRLVVMNQSTKKAISLSSLWGSALGKNQLILRTSIVLMTKAARATARESAAKSKNGKASFFLNIRMKFLNKTYRIYSKTVIAARKATTFWSKSLIVARFGVVALRLSLYKLAAAITPLLVTFAIFEAIFWVWDRIFMRGARITKMQAEATEQLTNTILVQRQALEGYSSDIKILTKDTDYWGLSISKVTRSYKKLGKLSTETKKLEEMIPTIKDEKTKEKYEKELEQKNKAFENEQNLYKQQSITLRNEVEKRNALLLSLTETHGKATELLQKSSLGNQLFKLLEYRRNVVKAYDKLSENVSWWTMKTNLHLKELSEKNAEVLLLIEQKKNSLIEKEYEKHLSTLKQQREVYLGEVRGQVGSPLLKGTAGIEKTYAKETQLVNDKITQLKKNVEDTRIALKLAEQDLTVLKAKQKETGEDMSIGIKEAEQQIEDYKKVLELETNLMSASLRLLKDNLKFLKLRTDLQKTDLGIEDQRQKQLANSYKLEEALVALDSKYGTQSLALQRNLNLQTEKQGDTVIYLNNKYKERLRIIEAFEKENASLLKSDLELQKVIKEMKFDLETQKDHQIALVNTRAEEKKLAEEILIFEKGLSEERGRQLLITKESKALWEDQVEIGAQIYDLIGAKLESVYLSQSKKRNNIIDSYQKERGLIENKLKVLEEIIRREEVITDAQSQHLKDYRNELKVMDSILRSSLDRLEIETEINRLGVERERKQQNRVTFFNQVLARSQYLNELNIKEYQSAKALSSLEEEKYLKTQVAMEVEYDLKKAALTEEIAYKEKLTDLVAESSEEVLQEIGRLQDKISWLSEEKKIKLNILRIESQSAKVAAGLKEYERDKLSAYDLETEQLGAMDKALSSIHKKTTKLYQIDKKKVRETTKINRDYQRKLEMIKKEERLVKEQFKKDEKLMQAKLDSLTKEKRLLNERYNLSLWTAESEWEIARALEEQNITISEKTTARQQQKSIEDLYISQGKMADGDYSFGGGFSQAFFDFQELESKESFIERGIEEKLIALQEAERFANKALNKYLDALFDDDWSLTDVEFLEKIYDETEKIVDQTRAEYNIKLQSLGVDYEKLKITKKEQAVNLMKNITANVALGIAKAYLEMRTRSIQLQRQEQLTEFRLQKQRELGLISEEQYQKRSEKNRKLMAARKRVDDAKSHEQMMKQMMELIGMELIKGGISWLFMFNPMGFAAIAAGAALVHNAATTAAAAFGGQVMQAEKDLISIEEEFKAAEQRAGGTGSQRFGGTVRAENLTINITPTMVISGEQIFIGSGSVQEFSQVVADNMIGHMQEAIDTGQVDMSQISNTQDNVSTGG